MAKLIIGKAPASFPLAIEVNTPSGAAEVTLTAKHLPATEWARIRDEHSKAVEAQVKELFDAARKEAEAAYEEAQKDVKPKKGAGKPTAEEAEAAEAAKEAAITALIKPVPQAQMAKLRSDMSAALIARIATGWDLDDEFTELVVAEACDLYQGMAEAVFGDYNKALEGRRAKN